ncbi:MAG: ATP-binding cassette domain-containing protein, partial [candidate division WOR-3 bacterium]
YFLDGLVERIWAIEGKRVLAFSGNYSQYLQDKEHRDELQLKRFEEQQRFIRRTERFIAQFRARKDTAKRAQSRQKMLDRLERIEPPRVLPQIRIRFPEAERIYGKAFELKGVSKAFGGKRLFQGVNLTIAGSERVGVFGPNGAGKTTLLEIIAGSLEPDSGTVWRSAKIRIAYYRQGAEGLLDERRTVLEAVAEATTGYTENELKGILGMFLFPGDAIEKRVGVLSGGERSRLAIIRALLEPSNLLILDEPTNHLDIESREVLIRAIESYHRCVVFAAHDRFMLDRLATRTILVENGEVVQFPGNYSYATGRVGQVETKPELAGPAVEGSESEPHSPTSIIKRTNVVERLEERLKQVRAEYQAALAVMDFSRARMLAMEEKELETEINARKADEVADSTTEV